VSARRDDVDANEPEAVTAHDPKSMLRERAARMNHLVRLQESAELLCPHSPTGVVDRDADCRRRCGVPSQGYWEMGGRR
jgi:hypothetical protein